MKGEKVFQLDNIFKAGMKSEEGEIQQSDKTHFCVTFNASSGNFESWDDEGMFGDDNNYRGLNLYLAIKQKYDELSNVSDGTYSAVGTVYSYDDNDSQADGTIKKETSCATDYTLLKLSGCFMAQPSDGVTQVKSNVWIKHRYGTTYEFYELFIFGNQVGTVEQTEEPKMFSTQEYFDVTVRRTLSNNTYAVTTQNIATYGAMEQTGLSLYDLALYSI